MHPPTLSRSRSSLKDDRYFRRHVLPSGRLVVLGATLDFHLGLLIRFAHGRLLLRLGDAETLHQLRQSLARDAQFGSSPRAVPTGADQRRAHEALVERPPRFFEL